MGSDCLPFFRTRQSQAVQFPLLPTSSQHPTHAVLLSAVRNIRHGGCGVRWLKSFRTTFFRFVVTGRFG
ncbi:hypothetical protein R5R35_000053 [Gryllus longicercus]|uniref:Uncharacterized protein n=1 Tax=Gryllus longicercus TaxID=2509291 RepID=A0AAN9VN64_9ORTH